MKVGSSLATIGCCVCMKNSGSAILKKVKDCLIERQSTMEQLTVKELENSFNVEDILNSNVTEVAQMIGAVVHPQCLDSFSLGTFLSEDVQSSSVRTNLFPQSSTIPQYTSCSLCHSKDVHLPLNYTAVDPQGGERTCERGITTCNPAYRMLLWTGKCKVVNCHKRMHLGCFLKHQFMLKMDNVPEEEGISGSISVPEKKLFVLCETHHPRKILERKLKYQYCKLKKSLEVLRNQLIFNQASKSSNDQMEVISHSPLQSQLGQLDARVNFKEKFLDSVDPLTSEATNDSGSKEQLKNSYELIQGSNSKEVPESDSNSFFPNEICSELTLR